MPANEHVPISLDEVISEIATILARGYIRHRNGRRITLDSDIEAVLPAWLCMVGDRWTGSFSELTGGILR